MRSYWYHSESDSAVIANNEIEARECADAGCDEITEIEYCKVALRNLNAQGT